MGSKKKADDDVTHECEEDGNPPKKSKIDVLLLEVERKNFDQNGADLKYIVKQALDAIIPEKLSLSDQKKRFLVIPALFDSTIADCIIEIIVSKFPYVNLGIPESESPSLLIPTTKQLIDILDATGSSFLFKGSAGARVYGYACLRDALRLREEYAIPKTTLPQSHLQKLAVRNKHEFLNFEELKLLLGQKCKHWHIQAYLLGERLLKEYGCFPNEFILYKMYNIGVTIWRLRPLNFSRSVAISLYLFELFGQTVFLDALIINSAQSHDVVHSTFTELFNDLRDPQRNQIDLTKPDPILTFDHLMAALEFSFVYQVKLYDHAPKDEIQIHEFWTIKSKADKLEEISRLILVLLKLLVSIPKSKTQSKKLKSQLAVYINIYELKRAKQKPNLLLRVCKSHHGRANEFKLIKMLLKAGADPNAVDNHRSSPLHLLAKKECYSLKMWGNPSYSTRAENFTSIVRVILDGSFHEDQINLRGQSALECLKPLLPRYPNAQLCRLVGNLLHGVRPLSCIAAKVVRRHQLPCECLPVTLQSMVL